MTHPVHRIAGGVFFYVPEKSPARVLPAGVRIGIDYRTLSGKLADLLLRRDMPADFGLLRYEKKIVLFLSRVAYNIANTMG